MRKLLPFFLLAIAPVATAIDLSPPDPESNPDSALMLDLAGTTDPGTLDPFSFPQLPGEHTIISDVRDKEGTRVHQHAYVAHFYGRYWAMWSDGPGIPKEGATVEELRNLVPRHDQPDTRVSFATSDDGVTWSEPMDLSGPPRKEGFGWIARGYWIREDEVLALATHFNAPGYEGEGLSLEAFYWNEATGKWEPHGTVRDDSMNNFPPKKLPSGEWLMSRRDHQRQVTTMIGGVKSFDDWTIKPLASYGGKQKPEEPYWYVLPDGKNLVGLMRDNSGSQRLLRAFSTDNGESWSNLVTTNFPDAKSKFFALRTSRGYYALVSNTNPKKRDPLTLAISPDGLVYTHLFFLIGNRHIDYPHMIEHDGSLLIAFSGAKQTMEVMKISLDEIDTRIRPRQD